MALKINKKLNSGVVATYARISEVQNGDIVNGKQNIITKVIIEFWFDKKTRELSKLGGKEIPLQTNTYNITEIFSTLDSAYTFIKGLIDFNGAVDC